MKSKTSFSASSTLWTSTQPLRFVLTLALFGVSAEATAQRMAIGDYGVFLDEVGIMVDGTFVPGHEVTEEQLATNPLLYENHSEDHLQVFMPDGSTQVRYNDIANLSGTLTVVDAGEQGSEVSISADGLIPGGVYTAWIDLFQAPGFTPDFAHELAAGALGYDATNPPADPLDYVGNVFTADANGRGELLGVIQPPGPTSWFTTDVVPGFEVPPYVLDSPVAEFHVVLAYHMDGMSWGPRPGIGEGFDAFDATWVGYGGAVVVPEPGTLSLAVCGVLGLFARIREHPRSGV